MVVVVVGSLETHCEDMSSFYYKYPLNKLRININHLEFDNIT